MARLGGNGLLKILVAAGALVVMVAGVTTYLVGSAGDSAARMQSDSNATLDAVRTHANDANASVKRVPAFDVTGTNPDFAKAKQTADQYYYQLGEYRRTVEADQLKLVRNRDQLTEQASGLPSLPFRTLLDRQRARVESMRSALDAESAALKIMQDQMQALSAGFDAMGDFATVFDYLNKHDLRGALAVFPTLDSKLQTAAKLAAGPNTPPQVQKLMTSLQALSTDYNGYLQAVQRGDLKGEQALAPRIQADATALQTFDGQGLNSFERTLLQPYENRFDSGVRAAGFKPVT